MELKGYVSNQGDPLGISARAMLTQLAILNVHTDNIANYAIPGYQRKEPVVTSFVEYLGPQAVDRATNTEIGRLRKSGNPMDLALNNQGYFQKLNAMGGVELTRDGRFHIDKDGYVRALDGKQIASSSGQPLRLALVPADLQANLTVSPNGDIQVYDTKKGRLEAVDRIGVVSETGTVADGVDVKQGYVEDSNVMLPNEFVGMVPLRRIFEANRQIFLLQSDALSRMIQQVGGSQ